MPPLQARVLERLAPGGPLERRWPGYERRASQVALTADIAATFEQGGVLLAEAPTGIGKSLAYLLPGVLAAHGTDRRVVIATCTRALQDQLVERDLPALFAALGAALPVARLKGKQNYLCPRALELAEARGAEEVDTLEALRRWAAVEEEGDLDRFDAADPESFRRVRGRVATDPSACTLATCGRGRECFWVRARRQAAGARLLVVNHALLALSGEVEGLLPPFDLLVVDEAHRLEGVLLAQLERSVSRNRFEELLRTVGSGSPAGRRGRQGGLEDAEPGGAGAGARAAGGLLARVRRYALPLFGAGRSAPVTDEVETLARRVPDARAAADRLFAALELRPEAGRAEAYGMRRRHRSALELFGRDLEPLEDALSHCTEFARGLGRLAEAVGGHARPGGSGAPAGAAAEELAAELEEVAGRFTGLAHDLDQLAEAADPAWVYWRTTSGGRAGAEADARSPAVRPGGRDRLAGGARVELHGAPITVGEHARRRVLDRARAVVLTSATLSAGGDFAFLAERLGLGPDLGLPYRAASYPSPFPLERQMRAFVLAGRGEEPDVVADAVAALAHATGRNQLVLFTAHERLRRARERLIARLPASATLLAQDWDGTTAAVSERFRVSRGAVLLGVQSLWEGVDFPGEALEILVVAKLPFSVPDEPLVEARGERLRERGLDPFQNDALPEAVLRFRQGVGRLIRRSDDRGILVVCDPRLLTASYRRPFLAALPIEPRACADAGVLAQEAAAFLGAGPRGTPRGGAGPAGAGGPGGPPRARVEKQI